jgi:hypothetical protein
MRQWSRDLREAAVRALAGLGLVLALVVLGAVFVSTAVHGDEQGARDNSVALPSGGGFGEGAAPKSAERNEVERSGSRSDPSQGGVVLGVVILVGGIFVLGWGARRPERETAEHRPLQSVSD